MNDPEAYANAFDRRSATIGRFSTGLLLKFGRPPKAPTTATWIGEVRPRLARKFRRPARRPKASSGGLLPGGRRATRKRSKPLPKPTSSMSVHGLGRRCKGFRLPAAPAAKVLAASGLPVAFERSSPWKRALEDCARHKDAGRLGAIARGPGLKPSAARHCNRCNLL